MQPTSNAWSLALVTSPCMSSKKLSQRQRSRNKRLLASDLALCELSSHMKDIREFVCAKHRLLRKRFLSPCKLELEPLCSNQRLAHRWRQLWALCIHPLPVQEIRQKLNPVNSNFFRVYLRCHIKCQRLCLSLHSINPTEALYFSAKTLLNRLLSSWNPLFYLFTCDSAKLCFALRTSNKSDFQSFAKVPSCTFHSICRPERSSRISESHARKRHNGRTFVRRKSNRDPIKFHSVLQ